MISREEFDRQRRVLDQTISMQSRLRDIYRRRSSILAGCTMLLAVIIGGFAFAGDLTERRSILGTEANVGTWIGIGSCAVLFLSVLDHLVDWRGEAFLRQEAVSRLANLKSAYRSVDTDAGDFIERADSVSVLFVEVMPSVPPIPEGKFNRLKAWHRRKVAISTAIDESPGRPLLLVRWDVLRTKPTQKKGEQDA